MNKHLLPALSLLPFLVAAPVAAQTTDGTATTEGTEGDDVITDGGGETTSLMDRPFFVGGGVGGSFGITNGGGAAFSLEEDVGYRFVGFQIADGLDGAVWGGLSFGQAFGSGFWLLQFDGRGGVDLEVFEGSGVSILVTPSLALGGAIFGSDGPLGAQTFGAFDMQFSVQGEVTLLEGLLGLWLRPLSFELLIRDGVGVNYEVLAGVLVRL